MNKNRILITLFVFFICSMMLFFSACEVDINLNGNNNDNQEEQGKKIDDNEEDEPGALTEVTITLDTVKYTASTESNDYTVAVTSDKNYTYIYTTITFNAGIAVSKNVHLYVNGEEKVIGEFAEYTLTRTKGDVYQLVYRISDPNWTPFY